MVSNVCQDLCLHELVSLQDFFSLSFWWTLKLSNKQKKNLGWTPNIVFENHSKKSHTRILLLEWVWNETFLVCFKHCEPIASFILEERVKMFSQAYYFGYSIYLHML